MRKITRNAIVATVTTAAVVAVAFPVFLRAMGQFQNKGNGWGSTHASRLPSADVPVEEDPGGVPVEAAIGESFIVGEQIEVTVTGIGCQKEKGPLPELSQDWADYYGVIFDSSGTIQNDFVYVIVEATFKNVSDSAGAGEIRLNQSYLVQDVDGDVSPVAEVLLCDSVDLSAQTSNAGEYDLAPGESVTAHLGFIMQQDNLSNSSSPVYYLPDFTGASLYDPASVNARWVKVPTIEE